MTKIRSLHTGDILQTRRGDDVITIRIDSISIRDLTDLTRDSAQPMLSIVQYLETDQDDAPDVGAERITFGTLQQWLKEANWRKLEYAEGVRYT